tara:strand:+ start:1248 stop:1526 length:279 start_codon:yes stop_codon:yes gene_type:complete
MEIETQDCYLCDATKPTIFTKKNAEHYMKVRTYLFWMYANALKEILKGKKTVDVYTELMSAANIFNFSKNNHELYIKKSIKYFQEKHENQHP